MRFNTHLNAATTIVLLSVSLASLGSELAAQTSEKTPALQRSQFIRDMDAEFAKMDSNKDGKATAIEVGNYQAQSRLEEIRRRNAEQFASLDKDQNGQLTKSEFSALVPAKVTANGRPMVAQMDSDKDGKISLIEHRAATLVNFDRLDADKDGVVSAAEMRAGGITK